MGAVTIIICVFISALTVWVVYKHLYVRNIRLLALAALTGLGVYLTIPSSVIIISKEGDNYKHERVRTFFNYKQFKLSWCEKYILNTTPDLLVVYPVVYTANGGRPRKNYKEQIINANTFLRGISYDIEYFFTTPPASREIEGNSQTFWVLDAYNKFGEEGWDDIKKMTHAAKSGNMEAMSQLAFCYLQGIDVKADVEKAFYWAKKAEKSGHPAALFVLSCIYADETSKRYDVEKAYRLLNESVEKGFGPAEYTLGMMYCKEDKDTSIELLKRAASHGIKAASEAIRNME